MSMLIKNSMVIGYRKQKIILKSLKAFLKLIREASGGSGWSHGNPGVASRQES